MCVEPCVFWPSTWISYLRRRRRHPAQLRSVKNVIWLPCGISDTFEIFSTNILKVPPTPHRHHRYDLVELTG